MNDVYRRLQGLDAIHSVDRAAADFDILTTAQAIRRVAYSAAQLPLLVKLHGFPLPVEMSALLIGWKAHELDAWKQWRDDQLIAALL
ncbi:hypothetical protein [Sphingomonas taxi]|uniref:hypothetical protein n=1 Tax=Sphingomonas taxi TaxID=1549858 RepID=UPI0012E0254F|nr:hypothetical protein [Sphingomonas taxi]